MTLMVKRWYRSRRLQIVILILVILSVIFYGNLNESLEREPDLDVTRRSGLVDFATLVSKKPSKPVTPSINLGHAFSNSKSHSVSARVDVTPVVSKAPSVPRKPDIDIGEALRSGDRDALAALSAPSTVPLARVPAVYLLDHTYSFLPYIEHQRLSRKLLRTKTLVLNVWDETVRVIEYIENKLEEALKLDKGSGCEIPDSDPFAPEIMKFDKKMADIECEGTDWVKCYLSECRVVDKILKTTTDISCTYEDIIYQTDHKYYHGPPITVKGAGVYKLEKSDHVKIKCTGTHSQRFKTPYIFRLLGFNAVWREWDKRIPLETLLKKNYIGSKWVGHHLGFRTSVERIPPPPGREDTINILIFGFDSTSRNGFIRKMPKSYEYVKNHLEGTLLNGYNIVGDGTPAALFPIMTGKTELELPDVRKVLKRAGTMDDMPFIFNRLKQDGYRTAYFEDMPWIGTFQYRFNGFNKQPADHYLRQFYIDEDKTSHKRSRKPYIKYAYCIGDTPQFKLMLNITDQFFKLDGKKFGFTFIADITHDDFNMISTADEATAQFLRAMKESGRLEDTMLFMMGDHGARYANLRNTLQGKLEERLPLMFVRLPEKLKRKRPSIQAALEANANVLTTPHDIHATILDAMDLPQYYNPYKVAGADLKRGLSLLEPIPKNRSCSEAGIEPHWCACLSWTQISRSHRLYNKSAEALMQYINQLTESRRDACVPRTLTSIEWVMQQRANTKMLSFIEAKDADGYVGKFGKTIDIDRENYQVKLTVGPGFGIYEASMTYIIKDDKFLVDGTAISRVNPYGEEPSCISNTHPHLNMYCYCKNYVSQRV